MVSHMILLILDVNYCNQFYPTFSPHTWPWNEAHLTNVILNQVCGNSTYLSQSHCLIQNLLKGRYNNELLSIVPEINYYEL